MSYFENTKYVPYKFGTSDEFTLHQNLTAYVDLIDQVRNNNSFYTKQTILDGDRPDNLSYKLYGSTKYYWTFYLMNDAIRERGWPLTDQEVLALVQSERNNTTLISMDDLTNKFKIGSTVTGLTSGASGVVINRRLLLGQIIVSGSQSFVSGEIIQAVEESGTNTATLTGVADEWESVYEYVDSNLIPTDINPYVGAGAQLAAVSYYDKYVNENDELKDIIVIKPDAIASVFEQFQDAMRD